MKHRLAIVGAGEMFHQAKHFAEIDGRYNVVGLFVDQPNKIEECDGVPFLGKTCDIEFAYNNGLFDCLFIAIGYNHLNFKKKLHESLKSKIPFATIIANPTYIDKSASIGCDVIIYPGVIIDKEVTIDDNVILNLGATISHNSHIGKSTFIGVKTNISGFCDIGECCFLGTNSTLIDHIKICNDVCVGASALIIKDVELSGTYVGVPIRKVK